MAGRRFNVNTINQFTKRETEREWEGRSSLDASSEIRCNAWNLYSICTWVWLDFLGGVSSKFGPACSYKIREAERWAVCIDSFFSSWPWDVEINKKKVESKKTSLAVPFVNCCLTIPGLFCTRYNCLGICHLQQTQLFAICCHSICYPTHLTPLSILS